MGLNKPAAFRRSHTRLEPNHLPGPQFAHANLPTITAEEPKSIPWRQSPFSGVI